jgi:hypothetical protein
MEEKIDKIYYKISKYFEKIKKARIHSKKG